MIFDDFPGEDDARQKMWYNNIRLTGNEFDGYSAKLAFFDGGFAVSVDGNGNVATAGELYSRYPVKNSVNGVHPGVLAVQSLIKDASRLGIIRQDEHYGTLPFAVFYEDCEDDEIDRDGHLAPVIAWCEENGFDFSGN